MQKRLKPKITQNSTIKRKKTQASATTQTRNNSNTQIKYNKAAKRSNKTTTANIEHN